MHTISFLPSALVMNCDRLEAGGCRDRFGRGEGSGEGFYFVWCRKFWTFFLIFYNWNYFFAMTERVQKNWKKVPLCTGTKFQIPVLLRMWTVPKLNSNVTWVRHVNLCSWKPELSSTGGIVVQSCSDHEIQTPSCTNHHKVKTLNSETERESA